MERLSIFILLAIIVTSCGNANKTEQLQLQIVTASLEKSNAMIEANSRSEMHAFKNRLSNPYENPENAQEYYSKAEAVNNLTDSIMDYLNPVKAKLKKTEKITIKNSEWSALYTSLKQYRTSILQLDTNARKEFDNHLEIINPFFDSTNNNSEHFISHFFNNSTTNGALAAITIFQNNILIAQYDINSYFNKKSLIDYDWYYQISAIVSQDKSYVKASDLIEITAGIVTFSKALHPQFKINGTNISLNPDGSVVYKLKPLSKLGNHSIPLEVEFIDFNGKKNILTKQINYTVINVDSIINKE